MKKTETLNTEISEMEHKVKEAEERNHSLRSKKKELVKELEGVRAQVESHQKEYRQLLKKQEIMREEEVDIMGTRYILLKHSHIQKQTQVMKLTFTFLFSHISICFSLPEVSWK